MRAPTDRADALGAYLAGLGLGMMLAVAMIRADAAELARQIARQRVADGLAAFVAGIRRSGDPEPAPPAADEPEPIVPEG